MTAVRTLAASRLSPDDRSRVAEAAEAMRSNGTLPEEIAAAVSDALLAVAEGRDVNVFAEDDTLTTTEAARLLGLSRPFLIKLLDEGRIPHHTIGRDRRIAAADVRSYLEDREANKRRLADSFRQREEAKRIGIAKSLGLTGDEAHALGL